MLLLLLLGRPPPTVASPDHSLVQVQIQVCSGAAIVRQSPPVARHSVRLRFSEGTHSMPSRRLLQGVSGTSTCLCYTVQFETMKGLLAAATAAVVVPLAVGTALLSCLPASGDQHSARSTSELN
jgi:hypothetical protein